MANSYACVQGLVAEYILILKTMEDGHNAGRDTVIQFDSIRSRNEWYFQLTDTIARAKRAREQERRTYSGFHFRARAKDLYDSTPFQVCVVILIMISYVVAVAEKQMVPEMIMSRSVVSAEDEALRETFQDIDLALTVLFSIELSLNLFAHGVVDFFSSRFNWFDTVVVAISIFSRIDDSLPGINVVRLFRFLRIVRLVRAYRELRVLLNALVSSMLPVLYSFVLFLMVMSMYAVLATDFFGRTDPASFGRFFDSLFTLFQIATGDSWASDITRSLADAAGTGGQVSPAFVKLFFTSFVLIVGMVLCNIVVAVLLDSFLTSMLDAKREKELEELYDMRLKGAAAALTQDGPLDALVKGFLTVSREDDLRHRIRQVYNRLDADHSNGLTLEEVNIGLKQFDSFVEGKLSREGWDMLSEHGKHLNSDGEMTLAGFEDMIKMQMRQYVNRKLVDAVSRLGVYDVEQEAILFALRQTMMYSFQTGALVESLQQKIDPIAAAASASLRLTNKQRLDALVLRPKRWAFRQWRKAVVDDNATHSSSASPAKMQHDLDAVVQRMNMLEENVSLVFDKVSDTHQAVDRLTSFVLGRGNTAPDTHDNAEAAQARLRQVERELQDATQRAERAQQALEQAPLRSMASVWRPVDASPAALPLHWPSAPSRAQQAQRGPFSALPSTSL